MSKGKVYIVFYEMSLKKVPETISLHKAVLWMNVLLLYIMALIAFYGSILVLYTMTLSHSLYRFLGDSRQPLLRT